VGSVRNQTQDLLIEGIYQQLRNASVGGPEGNSTMSTSDEIEAMVNKALKIYDADKTGMFDFALETSGGAVVSTRCTITYTERAGTWSLFNGLFNLNWWPLQSSSTSPRNAIQPGLQPGQCWAFKGQKGRLVVSLSFPMTPHQFSLEHIPRSLSPNGRLDSAPQDFRVYGLQSEFDREPVEFGSFRYDAVNGEPLQFFPVQTDLGQRQFQLVELEISSNHGHPEYTCLYRFRVHGARQAAGGSNPSPPSHHPGTDDEKT